MLFLGALGGRWSGLFWSQYLFAVVMSEIVSALAFWWLGYWASQYAVRAPEDISIS